MTVYFLDHHHIDDEEYGEYKVLGVFSSREMAEQALELYRVEEGFRDTLEGFDLEDFELDVDAFPNGFDPDEDK